MKIKIRCIEQKQFIILQCYKNDKRIINIKQNLIELRNQFKKNQKIMNIDTDGLKIFYQWNSSVTISQVNNNFTKDFNQLQIECYNRTTLHNIQIQKCKIISRTLYTKGINKIKILSYGQQKQYISEQIQKQLKQIQGKDIMLKSKFKIITDTKLQINTLLIFNADLYIASKGKLKLYGNNSNINFNSGEIHIDNAGQLYSEKNMMLSNADFIQNRGYIATQSQNSVVKLQTNKFRNTGNIKIQKLVIECVTFTNQSTGQIQSKKGFIFTKGDTQNKGLLTIYLLSINSQKKIYFTNYKKIITNQLYTKCHCFQNKQLILVNHAKIQGYSSQSFFINSGTIFPKFSLTIKNLHLKNTQDGIIVNQGQIKINIQAWINDGHLSSQSADTSIKVNDILTNKGVLVFKNGINLQSKHMKNQNKFYSKKNTILKINDLFRNQGSFKMQNLNISGDTIRNLSQMEVFNTADIKASLFINSNNLRLQNNTNLEAEFAFLKQGTTSTKNLNVTAKNFRNNSNFQTEMLNYKGQNFANDKNLKINKSGNINAKVGFSDSKNATTYLNDVVIQGMQVMNTQGKMDMRKGKIKVKDFYNDNQVRMQNKKQNFRGLGVNKLQMNNTHIGVENIDIRDKIISQGGTNGIYHRGLPQKIQQNSSLNKFIIHTKTEDFYKKLNIVLQGQKQQLQTICIAEHLNAWSLLQSSPVSVGNFYHNLVCNRFQMPQNKFYHIRRNNQKTQNWNQVHIPKHKQYGLNVQAKHICYRGKLTYEGEFLNLHGDKTQYDGAYLQVPEGILSLSAFQTLNLVNSYLDAKGIMLNSVNQINIQATKFVSGLQGIIMNAKKVLDRPTIKTHVNSWWSGDQYKVHTWQTAKRSQYLTSGSIIIKAEDYIHLISPYIQSKQKIWINSPNTVIHGIFLLDKTQTKVYKSTCWGSQKVNTYMSRNDKAFGAKLTAQQIIFKGGAKFNAKIKANKLYDLTKKGIQMFFVIGYYGEFQNRQFANYITQGCQGYSRMSEKLLKADLKQLIQIYRPPQLGGLMIFDTVDWGKKKALIQGVYKQKIYKCKTFYEAWHHQSIGPGAMVVLSIAAAFAGANIIAPYFTTGLVGWQAVVIKAGISTLTQRLVISVAANGGNLGKAFNEFFSIQTVKALAFNIATAGLNKFICDKLEINVADPTGKTAPKLTQVFKQNLVKHAISVPLNAIINGNLQTNLKDLVVPFVADVFGQYTAGQIGLRYRNDHIDYLTHKALHGIVGGLTGFITKGDWKGAAAGAVGAIVAQVALQAMVPKPTLNEKAMELVAKLQKGETIGGFDIYKEVQLQLAVAKIIGAVTGGALTGDWSIARYTSQNAIDNNAWPLILAVGQIAFDYVVAKSLKYLYDKYVHDKIVENVNISQKQKAQCQQLMKTLGQLKDYYSGLKRTHQHMNNQNGFNFDWDKQKKMIESFDPCDKNNQVKLEKWAEKVMSFKWSLPKIKYMIPFIAQKGVHFVIDNMCKKAKLADMFMDFGTRFKDKDVPKANYNKLQTDKKNILKVDKSFKPLK